MCGSDTEIHISPMPLEIKKLFQYFPQMSSEVLVGAFRLQHFHYKEGLLKHTDLQLKELASAPTYLCSEHV